MPPVSKSTVERRRSSRQIAKRADVGQPAKNSRCEVLQIVPSRGGGSCAALTLPKPEVRNVAKCAGNILDTQNHVRVESCKRHLLERTGPEAVSV
jgi:hypothetical protein